MPWQSYFFHNGIHRLSYGWENPNHAAAVLVCALPLFWSVDTIIRNRQSVGKTWKFSVRFAEILYCLLIALTYSRGGIVAWLVSLLFFGFFCIKPLQPHQDGGSALWSFWGFRLAVITTIIAAAGVITRFVTAATGDASVTHRIELWLGGLNLIEACPLGGWGHGNSGEAFMQWVQRPEATSIHGGMTNSFLQAAVEFGLPFFGLCCALLLSPIWLTLKSGPWAPPIKRELLYGCAAGIIGFSVASIFTTLWVSLSVIWAPVVLIVIIGYLLRGTNQGEYLPLNTLWIASLSAGLALMLYLVAVIAASRTPWRLHKNFDGSITFSARHPKPDSPKITFLSDDRTLGWYFGKEIRRAIESSQRDLAAFTICPVGVTPRAAPTGYMIAFGPRVADQEADLSSTTSLCFVCPAGPPNKDKLVRLPDLLILPQQDQMGYSTAWRAWATENHTKTRTIPGTGQDIRNEWPHLLQSYLSGKDDFETSR